jgi:hypothetical protein
VFGVRDGGAIQAHEEVAVGQDGSDAAGATEL